MRNAARSSLITLALAVTFAAWGLLPVAPRAWEANEVSLAWWAWRQQTPTVEEIKAVVQQAKTPTLFLRAGQIEAAPGGLRRIRAVAGAFPQGVELHLVYNATRSLLAQFEYVAPATLAATVVASFNADTQRAAADCVTVTGIQLDIDVPSRLLPQYRQVLLELRNSLPPGTELSITGLATWLPLPEFKQVLAVTDFWIPQCYGYEVPQRLEQATPIASRAQVAQVIAGARELGQPFYAGLAAYGYALHYDAEGQLLEMRGDLDPRLLADHLDLTLTERRPFTPPTKSWFGQTTTFASAWCYVYRVQRLCVIDGMTLKPGEAVLLDVPTAASLRAQAQAVREQAGARLLGICIFRLPGADDPTNLTASEIASALADSEPQPIIQITSEGASIVLANNSAVSSLLGEGAVTLTLRAPAGSFNNIAGLQGFRRIETLCAMPDSAAAQSCSARRANLLRLSANHLRSGEQLRAELGAEFETPLTAELEWRTDDGRVLKEMRIINLTSSEFRL